MPRAFDWNKVGEELTALVEAIDEERPADTVPVYPMVTNEFGMSVLSNLWARGWRLVQHTDGLIPEMQAAFDEAFPGWRDHFPYRREGEA